MAFLKIKLSRRGRDENGASSDKSAMLFSRSASSNTLSASFPGGKWALR